MLCNSYRVRTGGSPSTRQGMPHVLRRPGSLIPREPYFGFAEYDESTFEHLTLIYGRIPMFYRVLSSNPRALEAVMGLSKVVQWADTASARLIKQSIILNVSLAKFQQPIW